MENHIQTLTFKELTTLVAKLAQDQRVTDDTKVLIDTGWDSVQEVATDAFHVETIMKFEVTDVVTQEVYPGFVLKEKADRVKAFGEPETAIILRNLY